MHKIAFRLSKVLEGIHPYGLFVDMTVAGYSPYRAQPLFHRYPG